MHANPKISSSFKRAFKGLNPEQQLAVEAIDGPVMVIAGPGTGKTQVLSMRIANILLKTDTQPSSILALTFTESGTKAMRDRLIQLIGETAYRIPIMTFHAFCLDVIRDHPEYFPIGENFDPLSDLERYQLLENIIMENDFVYLKPINKPLHYLKSIQSSIQDLKREGIAPDNFFKIIEEEKRYIQESGDELGKTELRDRTKSNQKHFELLQIYRLYQQQLHDSGRTDFEDMITLTREALLEHEDLLLDYQEKFQYLLVDEYQDTNSAQNQVVDAIASYWGEQANLFVVGDPHQSIFRFQGASLENVLSYLDRYPAARIINLSQNYRSTQLILDSAQALIANNPVPENLPLVQNLKSQHDHDQPIQVVTPTSTLTQSIWLALEIDKLIEAGEKPSEIAVIVRHNADIPTIATALGKWDIPYRIEGGTDALNLPVIQQLTLFLQVIHTIQASAEDVDLFTVLNYEWLNLPNRMILRVFRYASQNQLPPLQLFLSQTEKGKFLKELTSDEQANFTQLDDFVAKLVAWAGDESQQTLVAWLEKLITESGYLQHVLSRPDHQQSLSALTAMFDEIKRLSSRNPQLRLTDWLKIMETMNQHHLTLSIPDLRTNMNAVTLLTAHKSKGLEWETVFMTTLIDGKWGNNRSVKYIKLPENILKHTPSKDSQLDDERRLFYVSLTRAKQNLYLSIPQTQVTGSQSKPTVISQFIGEIPSEFKQVHAIEDDQIAANFPRLLQPAAKLSSWNEVEGEVIGSKPHDPWLSSLIDRFKLSSTALNTYLDCGYKFKLNHLLKIPRAKIPYLAFGSAIHSALEFLYDELKNTGKAPSVEKVLASFEKALSSEILTMDDYHRWLAKGSEMLTNYYHGHEGNFTSPVDVERVFGKNSTPVILDDIPLSGKIDKVEWIDSQQKTVKVIDYKTGKPRSRNDIEGKTKSSTGHYKRQLVFYQLLSELDKSFQMKVTEAEFEFIEPTPSGKYVKHSFMINEADVEELKTQIREVMTKIRDQQFERTTDYTICERCPFKFHCWPEGFPVEKVDYFKQLQQ